MSKPNLPNHVTFWKAAKNKGNHQGQVTNVDDQSTLTDTEAGPPSWSDGHRVAAAATTTTTISPQLHRQTTTRKLHTTTAAPAAAEAQMLLLPSMPDGADLWCPGPVCGSVKEIDWPDRDVCAATTMMPLTFPSLSP